MPSVECLTFASTSDCPIHVRYADVPGALSNLDLTDGCIDCHLVQIQPSRDGRGMEVHFTGCPCMLGDLAHAFDLHDIADENQLMCPLYGEYRRVGLVVGIARECMDENGVRRRVGEIGRPVEFENKLPFGV